MTKNIRFFAELNRSVEALLFKSHNSNEAIFYPWGKGGEGYLLNHFQKQRVSCFAKASLVLIFTSWFVWICLKIYSFTFLNYVNFENSFSTFTLLDFDSL